MQNADARRRAGIAATALLGAGLGALLMLSAGLGGCKTIGAPFPYDAVERIVVGQTTMEEVRAIFGPPYRVGREDGLPTWTYVDYAVSLFGRPRALDLRIKFDAQSRVRGYQYNTTEHEERKGG